MDLEPVKKDIVSASHILHQQGIAAELDVEGNQLAGDGRPNAEFRIHARNFSSRTAQS